MEEKLKAQLVKKDAEIEKLNLRIDKLKKEKEKKASSLNDRIDKLKEKNQALELKYSRLKTDFLEYKKKVAKGEVKEDARKKKTKSLWACLIDDYPETTDAIDKMQKKFSWTYLNHKVAAEVIRKCLEGAPKQKILPEFKNEKQLTTYFNFLLYLPDKIWEKEIFGGPPVSLQAALRRRPQIKKAIQGNNTVKTYWRRYLKTKNS